MTRPSLQAISPCFIASDVDQTIAFYRDKLGFETRFRAPDQGAFFAIIGRDGAQIFIKSDKDVSPLPNSQRHHYMRWDAYVYAPDPDALAAEFADHGAAFTEPLKDTHDGLRGFEISDPDGYVLFFAPTVGRRIYIQTQDKLERHWSEPTMANEPILTTIAPFLSVRNGAKAVDFYKAAFGATELFRMDAPDGSVVAQLAVEGAVFWLSDESPEHQNFSPETLHGGTVRMILTIDDPDAAFDRAVAAGAAIVCPIVAEHAWRIGRVLDPFGHHWEIGKPLPKPTHLT